MSQALHGEWLAGRVVTFRRATADDASAVRELTRAAYAKWVPTIGREPKPMAADYHAAVTDHLIDLLYVEGEFSGLIEMIAEEHHFLIENVAVQPNLQRCGYGRTLMAHAEQIATTLGYREIKLYTNKLFVENVQLYLRLGYQVDLEEEVTGGIVVYMSKRLNQH